MNRVPWERRRPVRLLGALLLALTIVGSTASATTATQQSEVESLDLPAMALMPADLVEAGLDGYIIGLGNLSNSTFEAGWLARWFDVAEDDAVDAFRQADADRVYKQFLDLRADPDDADSEIVQTVVSYVYVGEDGAGATALHDLIAEGAAATGEVVEDADTVGDASSMTVDEGRDPYTGSSASWLRLDIRAGSDAAGVVLIDYDGGPAEPDDAVALGERLLARIEAVRDGDSPGLAPLALQLTPDDEIDYPVGFYVQVDGESLPVGTVDSGFWKYLETTPDDTERAALYDEIGAVDVYYLSQELQRENGRDVHKFYYEVLLLRFEDEDAAEDYMTGLPDRLDDEPTYKNLRQLDDVPRDGDEALAFAYHSDYEDGLTYFHRPTYIRVGAVIARVDVLGIEPVNDGAVELAEAQAACLADGGCPDPLEAPADVRAV